jgi:hypothetical protein
VSINLPAGTAGAVVAIKDYANTFDTNAVTLVQNGSDKIGGSTVNATLSTEGIAVTLVFIDSTQGWLVTDSGLQSESPTAAYVTATGGTTTTCGDFKIHTFTGPGTFCVSNAGNASGNNEIEYIVVAGGGGAGYDTGGGGGAGGFRFASPSLAPATYPGKPLAAPAGLTASVASFPIVVGGGGTSSSSQPNQGSSGSNSVFSTITSTGGGGGGSGGASPGNRTGLNGGSGGGGGNPNGSGGNGNTPTVSPAQGKDGGDNQLDNIASGGGGGAIAAGTDTQPSDGGGPAGDGAGMPTAFGSNGVPCGSFRYYAGGGGGGGRSPSYSPAGSGGKGGGGAGVQTGPGNAGIVNTGGGAGGPSGTSIAQAGAGGSGIVIIRYKFQN